jgi:hypothetical protein
VIAYQNADRTNLDEVRRTAEERQWVGMWITLDGGRAQVVSLAPKNGHVWVVDEAGEFHELVTTELRRSRP